MVPGSNAIPTVTVFHRRMGKLIINARDLDTYRKDGWALEGEELQKSETDAAVGSMKVTAKEAIEAIGGLSADELGEFVTDAEDRKTVLEARDERIDEIEEDE